MLLVRSTILTAQPNLVGSHWPYRQAWRIAGFFEV